MRQWKTGFSLQKRPEAAGASRCSRHRHRDPMGQGVRERRNQAALAQIHFWDAGAPGYRWMQLTNNSR